MTAISRWLSESDATGIDHVNTIRILKGFQTQPSGRCRSINLVGTVGKPENSTTAVSAWILRQDVTSFLLPFGSNAAIAIDYNTRQHNDNELYATDTFRPVKPRLPNVKKQNDNKM